MVEWLESISGETWMMVAIVCGGLLVIGVLVSLIRSGDKPKVMCICPHCGADGYPKIIVPGSSVIALLMILFFIVPAVIYTLLRQIGTRRECPLCGNEGMVPADSPGGLQLEKQFHRVVTDNPLKPQV